MANPSHSLSAARAIKPSRLLLYVLFGVILPTQILLANWVLSRSLLPFNVVYVVAAQLLLPRPGYIYITLSAGMITLLIWLLRLRKRGPKGNAMVGGLLLCSVLCHLIFALLALKRLWIAVPLWGASVGAAWVFWVTGWHALRIAAVSLPQRSQIQWASVGAVGLILVPLLVVPQPWKLVWQLPDISGADLGGRDLRHIYMEGCTGINLERVNLSDADLRYASFLHCELNMNSANLERADLRNAVFDGVDLSGANLRDAQLAGLSIGQTILDGADLRNASLDINMRGRVFMTQARLCGADLSGLENPRGGYGWSGARYDMATQWPPDFDPVQARATLVDGSDC